jgi:hypothetical protein
MTRVPSRHTYLPSVGLSLLVGGAAMVLYRQWWPNRRAALAVVAVAIVTHNAGYIWTRKHGQFIERARPTEELIEVARQTQGHILVECFPYASTIARNAVEFKAGIAGDRLIFVERPECREWRFTPVGNPAQD